MEVELAEVAMLDRHRKKHKSAIVARSWLAKQRSLAQRR
jgi:hypothetical protein